jgi:hypothetical protein
VARDADLKTKADLIIVNEMLPSEWQQLADDHFHQLRNESIVIFTSIHQTRNHSTQWKNVCADHHVTMSIDLYGIGIVLFRKEFKEQQHFILKYNP